MPPDPETFGRLLSAETGLPLDCVSVRASGGRNDLELFPSGHQASQTFRIRAGFEWRGVQVSFHPGAFAGDLVAHMNHAPAEARVLFTEVLKSCIADGATVNLQIDSQAADPFDAAIWGRKWTAISLSLRRGQLDVNTGDDRFDLRSLGTWTGRLAAAALALLPVEPEAAEEVDVAGFPEGAKVTILVDRYERDRRNRAAALAIHGYRCSACDTLLSERYGDIAATLIEVHHTTPVSKLGAGYVINPKTDLVPLCPNCHSVAHRRTPPFDVAELKELIGRAADDTAPR